MGSGDRRQSRLNGRRAGERGPAQPFAARQPRAERAPAATKSGAPPSALSLNRISVYLRTLRRLQEAGVERVSSFELGRQLHLSAAQIRKDLAQFGEFGVRGVGYQVSDLASRLSALLGFDRVHRLVIVGMGNLGTAIARSPAFNSASFQVVAAFDSDPRKIGRTIGGLVVRDPAELRRVVKDSAAELGLLAVPADEAATSLEQMRATGLQGVLNFAAVRLQSHPGLLVKNVDLTVFIEELAFFARHGRPARRPRRRATAGGDAPPQPAGPEPPPSER